MEKKERDKLIELLNGIDDLSTQAFILVPRLEDFIDEERNKAREEGIRDGMRGMLDIAEDHGFPVSVVIKDYEIKKMIVKLKQ